MCHREIIPQTFAVFNIEHIEHCFGNMFSSRTLLQFLQTCGNLLGSGWFGSLLFHGMWSSQVCAAKRFSLRGMHGNRHGFVDPMVPWGPCLRSTMLQCSEISGICSELYLGMETATGFTSGYQTSKQ